MSKVAGLMSLAGRTALVTGAAGHIGQAFCETLAELGADVLMLDRPGTDFSALAARLGKLSKARAIGVHCDLENDADRKRVIENILKTESKLNILVNNAAFVGTSDLKGWATPFQDQSIETWRRALEVNLTAALDLTKGLSHLMKSSVGANVVNIASIYGVYAPDYSLYEGTAMGNPAAYAASKGGLIQLTRWLATTLAPHIRVNAISPGGVFRNQTETFVKRYEAKTPLGRMACEQDMQGALAYLCSDLAAYVTGQNLMVDGGWGLC